MKKIRLVIGCLILVILAAVFNILFIDDVHSYTRVMMDEMYSDGPIDVLFSGSSHTYRSYDIGIIEEITGVNAFNVGSSAQQLQGAYYLIREANEKNGVSKVVLDVSYSHQMDDFPGEKQTYLITDYLRSPMLKYDYLWKAFGLKGVCNGVLPVIHSCDFSIQNLKDHIKRDYLANSYKYITYEDEEYRGQGFVYSHKVFTNETGFGDATEIDESCLLSEFSKSYLDLIVKYCKENDISLVIVNPPIPDATLQLKGDYQLYVDVLRNISSAYGIDYWDFNLVKEDVLTLDWSDYCDEIHLNGKGAGKYSECVANLLNMGFENAFYDTFEEKLNCNPEKTDR